MLCASHSVCWVHHQRKFQLDLPPYLRDFRATCSKSVTQASLPGDNRALEPPDSIPNSEVKRRIADGSVGFPHVRVGHCQAFIKKGLSNRAALFFLHPIYLFPTRIYREGPAVIAGFVATCRII